VATTPQADEVNPTWANCICSPNLGHQPLARSEAEGKSADAMLGGVRMMPFGAMSGTPLNLPQNLCHFDVDSVAIDVEPGLRRHLYHLEVAAE
jgi:hypothetical protein